MDSSPIFVTHSRVHSTASSSRSQMQLARKIIPSIRPWRSQSRSSAVLRSVYCDLKLGLSSGWETAGPTWTGGFHLFEKRSAKTDSSHLLKWWDELFSL